MAQRLILILIALVGLGMIALALVWPQGQGAVSPGPFARPLTSAEETVNVNGRPVATIRGSVPADVPAPPVAAPSGKQ